MDNLDKIIMARDALFARKVVLERESVTSPEYVKILACWAMVRGIVDSAYDAWRKGENATQAQAQRLGALVSLAREHGVTVTV